MKNGYGPHRILEKTQQEMLGKSAKEEGQEDSDSSLKADEIAFSNHKYTEGEK